MNTKWNTGKLDSLGSYTGVEARWHAGDNTKYTTTLMNFKDKNIIGFRVEFPVGASDTSLFNSTDKASHSRTITNFPAFTDYLLKDMLSWCAPVCRYTSSLATLVMLCLTAHDYTQAGKLHALGPRSPISGTSRGTDGETWSCLCQHKIVLLQANRI